MDAEACRKQILVAHPHPGKDHQQLWQIDTAGCTTFVNSRNARYPTHCTMIF